MCNYLHPRGYPWIKVRSIPESGIAYKITEVYSTCERTPFYNTKVKHGVHYTWINEMPWDGGDGFTCIRSLADARRVLKRMKDAHKCCYTSRLRIHLIRYTGGLGERFERSSEIQCQTAIVKEFEYGPVVE